MDKEIKKFDHVVLKDGRDGAVVELMDTYALVEVGSSPEDWETVKVELGEIVKVMQDELPVM